MLGIHRKELRNGLHELLLDLLAFTTDDESGYQSDEISEKYEFETIDKIIDFFIENKEIL
jgi:hypothetical protein